MQTADRVQNADRRLFTKCRLQTGNKMQAGYKLKGGLQTGNKCKVGHKVRDRAAYFKVGGLIRSEYGGVGRVTASRQFFFFLVTNNAS